MRATNQWFAVVGFAALAMLTYAPWSECALKSELTCYDQQVNDAIGQPINVPPNYWFFWEVPKDRIIAPAPSPFDDLATGGNRKPNLFDVKGNSTPTPWGWRMNLHRLSRQYGALALVALVGWWIVDGRRRLRA